MIQNITTAKSSFIGMKTFWKAAGEQLADTAAHGVWKGDPLPKTFMFVLGFEMRVSVEDPLVVFPLDINTTAELPCNVGYVARSSGGAPVVSSF